MTRTLSAFVAFVLLFAGGAARAGDVYGMPAAEPTPEVRSIVLYDASGAGMPNQLDLERGVPKAVYARAYGAGGKLLDVPITWIADPVGVVKITTSPRGKGANIVAVRDLFDDPNGLEPWTNIRACVKDVCRWMFVSSIISLSGKWTVDVQVSDTFLGIGGETRHMTFVQTGRTLQCFGAGKLPMTAIIRGRSLDFNDPNGKLTRFSGSILRRAGAEGTWASNKGHYGKWEARR